MDKIKILKVEPGEPPCGIEIANVFKASQAEVEGDIESALVLEMDVWQ